MSKFCTNIKKIQLYGNTARLKINWRNRFDKKFFNIIQNNVWIHPHLHYTVHQLPQNLA